MIQRRATLACGLFVALGACLAPVLATANDVPRHMRFATGNGYQPFTDEDLPSGGMATAILQRAFSKVGVTASISFFPWPRARRMAETGSYHGAFPYIQSPSRDAKFLFSDPITTYDNVAFVHADARWTADTVAEIPNGTYCRPRGYADFAPLVARRKAGAFTRRSPRRMATCFRLLADGRIDFVVAPEWQGWMTARDTLGGAVSLRTQPVVFEETSNHLIVSKQRDNAEAIIARFNRGLKKLKASGEYRMIVRRHLPDVIADEAFPGERGAQRDLQEKTQALWMGGAD